MQLCKYAKVTVFINKLFTDTLPCICPVQHNHSPWFLGVRIMQFIKNLITPKEVDFSWMSCLSFNHGTELKAEDSIRILSVSLAPYTSQVAFHWRAGCSNYPAEVTTWQPTPAFTLCHIVGASQLLPSLLAIQNMLLRVQSLAVIFSLSETAWQLETLNANSMPFSLLFMNSSKMLHLLSLPIVVSLEQKGGSLSLNWYHCCILNSHLVCFTHCSVIWQPSWVPANLHLQYNGFCIFCNAGIYHMQLKQKSSKSLSAITL